MKLARTQWRIAIVPLDCVCFAVSRVSRLVRQTTPAIAPAQFAQRVIELTNAERGRRMAFLRSA